MFKRLVPRSPRIRYLLVAILAFTLGSATIVEAAPAISLFRLADGTDASKLAAVDASGNVQVKVNNLPATQPVSGSVNVGNFPATQAVSGSVSVSNFPGTQPVSGTVSLSPTGNVIRDARTVAPVAMSAVLNFQPGDTLVTAMPYVVPFGKRLVIESISAEAGVPSGQRLSDLWVAFAASGALRNSYLVPTMLGTDGVLDYLAANIAGVNLVANEGQINVNASRTSSAGFASVQATLTGYLVDVP